MDERGGAVDGVDDPAEFVAGMRAGFLAADGMVGTVFFDLGDEVVFHCHIRFGDKVFDGVLTGDLYFMQTGLVIERNLAGAGDNLL